MKSKVISFLEKNTCGEEEMCAPPYDKHHLSHEEYEQRCMCAKEKFNCMIANNVIILRKKDIDNLESVFGKYLCNK